MRKEIPRSGRVFCWSADILIRMNIPTGIADNI